jgi:hypothetical protein
MGLNHSPPLPTHNFRTMLHPSKIEIIRWSVHGSNKKFIQIFTGKPNIKGSLGRHMGKCKKDIQPGIKETVWTGFNW